MSKPGGGIPILFAENTGATRLLFIAACDDENCTVGMAEDRQEAVDGFKRCEYDVALTNLQIPVLDRTAAARQM